MAAVKQRLICIYRGWGEVVLSGLGLTHCHRLRLVDGEGWCLMGIRTNGFFKCYCCIIRKTFTIFVRI